jgi:hypothetical protein
VEEERKTLDQGELEEVLELLIGQVEVVVDPHIVVLVVPVGLE